MTGKSPMYQHKDAAGNVSAVQFEWTESRNNAASDVEGRPIYDAVLMARIQSPGAKNQVFAQEFERRIYQGDGVPPLVRRNPASAPYADLLSAWQSGQAADATGTPLGELRVLDVARIASLRELGVHTLEALSALPDGALPGLGLGGRALREQAKAYLEAAAGQAPVTRLTAENEELRQQVLSLSQAVKELQAAVATKAKKEAA